MIAEPTELLSDARPALTARPALPPQDAARRMEELGRIILAYSEVTEKLQQSHEQLRKTVESLRQQLSEKNRLLERKNRLAALGEMAAGLAHEIRNPLGGIQLYASMLAHDVADRPVALQTVQKISGGVKRLDGLVSHVLQFAREVAINPQPVDLRQLIEQAVEYAQQTFETRKVFCRIEGPESMPVMVDPLLLSQVILNLLLNAAEAVEGGGKVTVRFDPPSARDGRARLLPSRSRSTTEDFGSKGASPSQPEDDRSAGREHRQFFLSVHDTGPGIPPQVLDRIFNPFFTTKDNGTGLGLAIVHRIIEAHDGTITASNEEGGGAKFEIRV